MKGRILVRGEWTNWGDGGYVVDVETPDGLKRLWSYGIRRDNSYIPETFTVSSFKDDGMTGFPLVLHRELIEAHRIAHHNALDIIAKGVSFTEPYKGWEIVDQSPFKERKAELEKSKPQT